MQNPQNHTNAGHANDRNGEEMRKKNLDNLIEHMFEPPMAPGNCKFNLEILLKGVSHSIPSLLF